MREDTEINMLNASNPDRVRLSGHSGNTPPASGHQLSATEQNFQSLYVNVESLNDSLDALEQRLNPVLMPANPSESDGVSWPEMSGLSERLATLCRRTNEMIYRVNSLASRIDL